MSQILKNLVYGSYRKLTCSFFAVDFLAFLNTLDFVFIYSET